ncbi:hypothetical protein CBL_01910 [Carabus blaptoides fortunei]
MVHAKNTVGTDSESIRFRFPALLCAFRHVKPDGPRGWPAIPPHNMSGGSRSSALGADPLLPSPASHSAVIVSPETLSHHSSPARALPMPPPPHGHRHQPSTSHVQLHSPSRGAPSSPGPLAIAPFHQHPAMRRPSRAERQVTWRQLGADALVVCLVWGIEKKKLNLANADDFLGIWIVVNKEAL